MLFSAGCIIIQASLTLNAQVRDHVLGDSPCQNASKCTAHLYMKESSADKDRWLQMLSDKKQTVSMCLDQNYPDALLHCYVSKALMCESWKF